MSITAELESLKPPASEDFRRQLEIVRKIRSQRQADDNCESGAGGIGVDRSRELNPISRPVIIRSVSK